MASLLILGKKKTKENFISLDDKHLKRRKLTLSLSLSLSLALCNLQGDFVDGIV